MKGGIKFSVFVLYFLKSVQPVYPIHYVRGPYQKSVLKTLVKRTYHKTLFQSEITNL